MLSYVHVLYKETCIPSSFFSFPSFALPETGTAFTFHLNHFLLNRILYNHNFFNGFCSVKHVMVTAFLLVCGAMTMSWICDTISESGFGIFLRCLISITLSCLLNYMFISLYMDKHLIFKISLWKQSP